MTDPLHLFQRYIEQRLALGEDQLVMGIDEAARVSQLAAQLPTPAAGEPGAGSGEQRARSRTGAERDAPSGSRARPSQRKARKTSDEEKWRHGAPSIPVAGLEVPTPAKDLFTSDPLANKGVEELAADILVCTHCSLCEERTNAVPGEGPPDARLMVVGEGPGAKEDETGRPFVGRAGELLTDILAAIECPRETVFIANIVKCRPPGNRSPERDEIDACIPYLYRQIEAIAPSVILAMGGTAACALLGIRSSLGSLRNKVHQFRGIPLVVTYHPAALLRNPHWKKPTWDDVRIARRLLAGDS